MTADAAYWMRLGELNSALHMHVGELRPCEPDDCAHVLVPGYTAGQVAHVLAWIEYMGRCTVGLVQAFEELPRDVVSLALMLDEQTKGRES